MGDIDVSLILNVHNEATLIQRTLLSLEAAARCSATVGLMVELVIVLDRSRPEFARHMRNYRSDAYVAITAIEVDRGSLGSARNDGIAVARGRYIATCDADDLMSDNMITNMYLKARSSDRRTIVIPEYYVCFGDSTAVLKYFDLRTITPLVFLQYHPYSSRIFADRSIFDDLIYQDLALGRVYAFEDWHLNALAIAKGYDFVTASETVIFYRKRADSLSSAARRRSLDLIPPNPLFEPETFQAVCAPYLGLLDVFDEADFRDFFDRNRILREASAFFATRTYRDMVLNANLLEPAISVEAYRPSQLDVPRPGAVCTGLVYLDLCRRLGRATFTDVFLLPSLKTGGSEKYMIQVMTSIVDNDPDSRILVICHDEPTETGWVEKLPPHTVMVSFDELKIAKNPTRNLLLLHKLLQNLGPGIRVHVKISGFMFEFFGRGLAAAFADKFVVFYRFCEERAVVDGNVLVLPNKFDFISNHIAQLDMIVSDHRQLIALDRRRIGTDPEKWVCLPAYCDIAPASRDPAATRGTRTSRFLWASRLVDQKFPMMLVLISEILARDQPDIVIDIYGGSQGDIDAVDPVIFLGCENLNYCGPYDRFDAIDTSRYDGFLYTTMFDGLPNVVLEAMASGLPVIAPACDGLPDVVLDGITGFLTPYGADALLAAHAYCQHIRTLSLDDARRVCMSGQCRDFIARHHSQAAHRRRVSEIFGLAGAGATEQCAGIPAHATERCADIAAE